MQALLLRSGLTVHHCTKHNQLVQYIEVLQDRQRYLPYESGHFVFVLALAIAQLALHVAALVLTRCCMHKNADLTV